MSTPPDEQQSALLLHRASAREIEAVAGGVASLVQEFEAAVSEGHFAPDFTQRLAALRATAKGLIDA